MNVLIVEDENSIREVEAAYLRHDGFNIFEAEDGEKGLEIFSKNKFDLVILDINLPKINGIAVCKKIRETSNVPIIMVTARVQDVDELVGFECGADDYIRKPFTPSIFLARVKSLLKRTEGNLIENKYLSIQPESMTVKVMDQKIELTTTEFNILYTLMRNAGKVFTRYQLIERSYEDKADLEILERTVDVHIKNIRKKIHVKEELPEFIVTVIGKGYKFNENL